jgi:VWFA-related protein
MAGRVPNREQGRQQKGEVSAPRQPDFERHATRALVSGALGLLITCGVAAQDQRPPFQSSVDVIPVDVTVVNSDGSPVPNLTPSDFTVRLDGTPHRVVSATWTPLPARGAEAPRRQPEYTSNQSADGGRLILLVIDQPNIRFGGAVYIRDALHRFIDRLQPADTVAVVGIGPGAPSLSFTSDRDRVKDAVAMMVGQRGEIGPDGVTQVLRNLLAGLASVEGPKTLLLVSEGIVIQDEQRSILSELARLAGAARTIIYALELDPARVGSTKSDLPDRGLTPAGQTAQPERPAGLSGGFRRELPDLGPAPGPADAPAPPRLEAGEGLSSIAAATGGPMFTVANSADAALARIESELAGYYLLGVETTPSTTGKQHALGITVQKAGVTVRFQHDLTTRRPLAQPRAAGDQVLSALNSAVVIPVLPLRVTTLSRFASDPSKTQVVIHAAVGSAYAGPTDVTLGFVITNAKGQVVERQTGNAVLRPATSRPSPLQFIRTATLSPGEYTLKLAMADGNRVGSVERPFRAGPADVGRFRFSDLIIGAPNTAPGGGGLPIIGDPVDDGMLQTYLEVSGTGADTLQLTYEITRDGNVPAMRTDEALPERSTPGGAVFNHLLSIASLKSGRYTLTVRVLSSDDFVHALSREFEVLSSGP